MSKQRKLILISAAVGIISMFLPWIKVSFLGMSSSVNGMHEKGLLVFLCFAVAGVIGYLGDQTTNLAKSNWFITVICAAVATLLMIWFYSDVSGSFAGDLLGFGFYLAALAAIAMLAGSFLFKSPGDSVKGGFDALKDSVNKKTD